MLVATHTKPGEISTELQWLLASYRGLQQRFQQREPDLIRAGDLNAGLLSTANNWTADGRFMARVDCPMGRHPPSADYPSSRGLGAGDER